MSRTVVGWLFVAVQFGLIVLLVVLPGGEDWATPRWLDIVTSGLVVAGLAFAGFAAVWLGRSLTASPVPRDGATLVTSGPFGHVRHPIYSGVLLAVLLIALGVTTVLVLERLARHDGSKS